MIGIVTSAVRDTMTNIMLTTKPKDTAMSNAASEFLFARRNVMIG